MRDRLEQGLKPIPACAVSAYVRDVDRRRAIESGFELCIPKPVTAEALASAVKELAGMTVTARIHFRANLLRGTYRIVLHVIDSHKLWPPIAVSGLASFVVHETTRVMGCSEVEPAYEIDLSPSDEPARLLRIV